MPIYEKLPFGGGTVMGFYPDELEDDSTKNPYEEIKKFVQPGVCRVRW